MSETGTEEKPTVEEPSQVKDSSEIREIAPSSVPNSPNSAVTNMTLGKSGTASLWVNLDKLKVFKAAVKLQGTTSLSDELNQFFEKRTAEIKGIVPNSDLTGVEAQASRLAVYEASKKRVFELGMELQKMIKFLKEQHAWTALLGVFCKYVDYDKTFDSPKISYGSGYGNGEQSHDSFCIRFIEESSDRDSDFRRETARFLMRNKDCGFVYDWVGFVEKLAERRMLSKRMLQYQVDRLTPEQLSQMQEEERHREENRLKELAEAKAEEERKKEEALKRRQEAQKRIQESSGQNQTNTLSDDDDEEFHDEDPEEESEEEEEDSPEEDDDLEGQTVRVPMEGEKKLPEECRAIVPVPGTEANGV